MDSVLQPVYVEYMPKQLEQGKLYISERFKLAIHLCCCGVCGWKTVTPLDETGWCMTTSYNGQERLVSLTPSIGNFQFPCKSHYWIKNNQVEWC
jgi:hypothetical protein